MIEPLKANERITYLHELSTAQALHNFIQHLDAKYNVDSTDPDNTFGRIFMDKAIIHYGISNILYHAHIPQFAWKTYEELLPKHTKIPKANRKIMFQKVKDRNGFEQIEPVLLTSKDHLTAPRTPIVIQENDILKLIELKENFKAELELHIPDEIILKDHMDELNKLAIPQLNDCNKDLPDKPYKSFDDLSQAHKAIVIADYMDKHNFASSRKRFSKTFMVPDYTGELHKYRVEYKRLSPNKFPYFSTTYKGWQNQYEMDPSSVAALFEKKWSVFGSPAFTLKEYDELMNDLKTLEAEYEFKEISLPF